MALFFECMQLCAQKVLDAADIVRDGDFSSTVPSDSNFPTFFETLDSGQLTRSVKSR